MISQERGAPLRLIALAASLLFAGACAGGSDDEDQAAPLEIEVRVEGPVDTPGIDSI